MYVNGRMNVPPTGVSEYSTAIGLEVFADRAINPPSLEIAQCSRKNSLRDIAKAPPQLTVSMRLLVQR
jgi:hypothetical protein